MEKYFVQLLLVLIGSQLVSAQSKLDTLWTTWSDVSNHDSVRIRALDTFTMEHIFTQPDSGISYARLMQQFSVEIGSIDYQIIALYRQGIAYYYLRDYVAALRVGRQCLALSKQVGNLIRESHALNLIGVISKERGDYQFAIDQYKRALLIAEQLDDQATINSLQRNIGVIYLAKGDGSRAKPYISTALSYFETHNHRQEVGEACLDLGNAYYLEQDYRKALELFERGYVAYDQINHQRGRATALTEIGKAQQVLGRLQESLHSNQQGLDIFIQISDPYGKAMTNLGLGLTYQQLNNPKSAVQHCETALSIAIEIENLAEQKSACECLYRNHKALGALSEALTYLERLQVLNDSLQLVETNKKLQGLEFTRIRSADSLEYLRQTQFKDLMIEKQTAVLSRQRSGLFSMFVLFLIMILLGLFTYRAKKHSDQLAEERRLRSEEAEKQSRALESSLREVQAKNQEILLAQEQLIQQEKLASIGRVTAGIAHEIKNPLNFITNFAEGSLELHEELDEMLTHSKDVRNGSVAVQELMSELKQNSVEIQQQGMRADRILCSMMDHLHFGKNAKKKVDLNVLIEEQVNLAYHSFRTENSDYSVIFDLPPDREPNMVLLHASDFARAIIHLLNNAFDAMVAKYEVNGAYQPSLKIHHSREPGWHKIHVIDNGCGMDKEKFPHFFEPFYTTKISTKMNPGLGLFIIHDIIVNGHHGRIDVKSEPGEYTEMVIMLPHD